MKPLWTAFLVVLLACPALAADDRIDGPQSRAGHMGSGTEGQKGRASLGAGQSQHLLGAPVQTQDARRVGTVEAVCLDQGEVVQLVVALAPEAGTADRRIALAYKDVEVRTERDPMVMTDLDVDALKALPEYRYRGDARPGKVFGDSSRIFGTDQATGSCQD